MTKSLQSRRARRGFTMIELLAVVMVIAVLAAFAIGNFSSHVNLAKEASVKADVNAGVSAALAYYAKNNNAFASIDTTVATANWGSSPGNIAKYVNATADSVRVRSSNASANRRCERLLVMSSGGANGALSCSAGTY